MEGWRYADGIENAACEGWPRCREGLLDDSSYCWPQEDLNVAVELTR